MTSRQHTVGIYLHQADSRPRPDRGQTEARRRPDTQRENYLMSLSTLPILSAYSGSCVSSDTFVASRYKAEFHAPYAMMIAALIAKNLTRRTVAGCTLKLLDRHKGQLLRNAGRAASSGLSAIYPANSSSISMRSSRQYLQTSDTIASFQKVLFLLPIGYNRRHFLTWRNNSHYPHNTPTLCAVSHQMED